MTMMAPLTEIAATPRKEMDSKFKFNNQPSVHKYTNMIPPPPIFAQTKPRKFYY